MKEKHLLNNFAENEILGIVLELYLKLKKGESLEDLEKNVKVDSLAQNEINGEDIDIFGKEIQQEEHPIIECVNCKCKVVCSRFAPHLEKCMGFGRTSSRIANRRISSSKKTFTSLNYTDDDSEFEEEKKVSSEEQEEEIDVENSDSVQIESSKDKKHKK